MPRLSVAWFLEEYRKHESGLQDKNPLYYWWVTLDRPILTACKNCPGHSDWCEVYAKVALVNRMYSAQLGRGKLRKYEAEDKVAYALHESNIDKFIEPLRRLSGLTETILPGVVKCHDRLVRIVRKGAKNDALSFSSKYLSFHAPRVVPIFDSRAVWVAQQILKGASGYRGYPPFEKHCRRILGLMDLLANEKIKPEIKIIDYVLYTGAS